MSGVESKTQTHTFTGDPLNVLKAENLDKNTIVWFMSDNGPWLLQNEEGGSAGLFRDGKGSTWEGPCFVQWPEYIRSEINENVVNAMDVYATCTIFLK